MSGRDAAGGVKKSSIAKAAPSGNRRAPSCRRHRQQGVAGGAQFLQRWAVRQGASRRHRPVPPCLRRRDRTGVGEGKGVSVRVDIGGRRVVKNKKYNEL